MKSRLLLVVVAMMSSPLLAEAIVDWDGSDGTTGWSLDFLTSADISAESFAGRDTLHLYDNSSSRYAAMTYAVSDTDFPVDNNYQYEVTMSFYVGVAATIGTNGFSLLQERSTTNQSSAYISITNDGLGSNDMQLRWGDANGIVLQDDGSDYVLPRNQWIDLTLTRLSQNSYNLTVDDGTEHDFGTLSAVISNVTNVAKYQMGTGNNLAQRGEYALSSLQVVPEPATLGLFVFGGLVGILRRRK